MACRVPGGGNTPERFWQLLRDGVDAVREVPADRWDGDAWCDPDLSAIGKSVTKAAGFLDEIDGFDADYFGILPREAVAMDPQQRLFMEVAIDALDDAGLTRLSLAGSRTGVFIASYHNDYAHLQYNDLEAVDARTLTGTLHSVLANRLSYFLDLRGPSLSVDTACSSSLVAVHLACQSLRLGESDIALAGGVSLIITPELMVSMSKVGFMAVDGRCKTFDEQANGFGRGEGCGLIVLKRLSDAIADGDRVLAVVRGSAVNQDGHSTLLAAPHGPAQEALIREALDSAQLSADRIGYVEAHGTGTALGDPIEVEAIAAALGRVPGAPPCLLGSAKANLGHLEAAAGAIGLIKAVLALRHGEIPPQAHFRKLSPHISLEGTRMAIPTSLTPWPSGAAPRCAAVSSFGVGGTNAHVIVEESPKLPTLSADSGTRLQVLPLSAHTAKAMKDVAKEWVAFLADTPATVSNLCFTAAQRRTHLNYRLAVVGYTKDEFVTQLQGFLEGAGGVGMFFTDHRPSYAAPRVGFVFSGQGPQWFAMGRELSAEEPVFQAMLAECDRLLRPLAGWSLLDELAQSEESTRLDQTEVAQPALFALQVALVELWKSWGVNPDAIIGHSVGEIAALYVAGVLDLPSAVRVVWHRGRIMQEATGLGGMASVPLTEVEALDLVRSFGERLSIGAINAPRSVVLSGETTALEIALDSLTRRGVAHHRLPVNYAFHSAQMAPFQRRLVKELADLDTRAPIVSVYSTVTGALADAQLFDAEYFGRNMREPVRFAAAIAAMANDGCDVFLEIGPHPVLGSAIAESLVGRTPSPVIVTSLRRGRNEREAMLRAAAAVHVAGIDLDWQALQPDAGAAVALPPYPWQHNRFWIRQRPAQSRPAAYAASLHPLLGVPVAAAGIEARLFEGDSLAASNWLADHRIFGRLLLPAAAAIETLAFAAGEVLSCSTLELQGFIMHRPLVMPEEGCEPASWQVVVNPLPSGQADVSLYQAAPARTSDVHPWIRIASARAARADSFVAERPSNAQRGESVSAEEVRERFAQLGVEFGPSFHCLTSIERGEGWARALAELPQHLHDDAHRYGLHPVLIDAAMQVCSLAAERSPQGELPARIVLPVGVDRVMLRRGVPLQLNAHAVLRRSDSIDGTVGTQCADVTLTTAKGEMVVSLEGLQFAPATAASFASATEEKSDPFYVVAWEAVQPLSEANAPGADGLWLVFVDELETAKPLIERMRQAGGRCLCVKPGVEYRRENDTVWMIDPADPQHYTRLIQETGWTVSDVRQAAVHCWNLDLPTQGGNTTRDRHADDVRGIGSVLHLAQALVRGGGASSAPLLIVTRGAYVVSGEESPQHLCPQAAGAWGLASVVAIEHPELTPRLVDLDPGLGAAVTEDLIAELLSGSLQRVAFRAGRRWRPRLQRHLLPRHTDSSRSEAPRKARRLVVAKPGTFDGVEAQPLEHEPLLPDSVRVRVMAAGLNFRDVLLTLGMYPGERVPLGAECAGVVLEVGKAVKQLARGSRVFGYATATLASEVVVPADFMTPMPVGMRFEDAAALPVAFLTAHHGLHGLARLASSERVLIHAAAGGVGMAAVQLALRCGAQVYATAGSPHKRELLQGMGVAQVMDSRTLDFADQVLQATGGEGVDVVLNSLAGEFIPTSLRTVAKGGCFLELGKRGVWTAEAMAAQRPDVRYYLYDLGSELQANHALLRPMIADLLAGLADRSLRPLPVTAFDFDEVSDAMRYMAQARHVGKIVLRAETSEPQATSQRVRMTSWATYWITGGLGALGLATARWLVDQGARQLVLSGRHLPDDAVQAQLSDLKSSGVTVRMVAVDAGDMTGMQAVLDDIQNSGAPLRGVVHAAGAVHDGVLLQQDWQAAREVLRGKAHGAWVLHELTRDLPLDFFILYSAAGVLLGASGQGVYPAANAQLDALAQARRRLGLPALSVAWGVWAGDGMATQMAQQGHDVWAARGLGKIDTSNGFVDLARLLADEAVYAAVLPIDWQRFLAQLPPGADREFFAAVAPASPDRAKADTALHRAAPALSIIDRLQAAPPGQRRQALIAHLGKLALSTLGLEADTPIDSRCALKDIGFDSLMAVEMRNTLNYMSPHSLPATLLFDYPTLDALATYLAKVWGLEAEKLSDPLDATPSPEANAGAAIIDMSDEEAEAALLAELERGAADNPQ
ncbi:MAG: SDR family NAD(P)-dependent oxidoreductase [Gammaproteobacteria bacterium]|nr:SDR family NAD(P)-dependent oxidoreductase [Gammaproteobacteria bacterium]